MGREPAQPPPAAGAVEVRAMFSRIASRYDLMNRLMTAGQDGRWRRATAAAAVSAGATVLDLGAGTGDCARELRRQGARWVVAADFSRPMLRQGRSKRGLRGDGGIAWLQADALRLPFRAETFDAVTSAFLLRNLVDLPAGLAEIVRVLKPGGRLVALDITRPPPGARGVLVRVGFERLVTPLAGLLSGDRKAYQYLPASVAVFPTMQELAALLEEAGATAVRARRLGGGGMALHTARKPGG